MKKLNVLMGVVLMLFVFNIQSNGQENKGHDEVFMIVEDMPVFPGGEEALKAYIGQSVKYPEIAKKNGIQGKVFVTFVVSKEGSVKEAKIARGVDPSLDKEALRVINELPKWKPGKQRGENVNVSYTVPIMFKLDGDKEKESEKVTTDGKPLFFIVEDMPEFPGGEEALRKFIAESIKYPTVAKDKGIQGKVYITFTVSDEGDVIDSKVVRGVDPSLDKEALRVVNELPKWKPGKQRGENVNVRYTIPINFELGATKLKEELKK